MSNKFNLTSYFGESLIYSSFQYYFILLIYFVGIYFIKYYDNPFFSFWFLFSFVPFLDEITFIDVRNPTKEEQKMLENQLRFKLPLYITLFMDWFFTVFLMNHFINQDFNLYSFLGYILLGGILAASNINIAHELMHKNNRLDQIMGSLTLSKNLYMHFYIEHIHGHHKNVATPLDPATSRFNETLYQFLPRTIIGSLTSAWNIEKKRLEKLGLGVFSIYNRMLYYAANNIMIPLIIYSIWGFKGSFLFCVTGLFGALVLEAINYIEHYGLQRKEIAPGEYEKVNISHSWNTSHRVSNYFLFKLQRHSDHHENGYKPYQILATYDESPQMPHGYPVCLLLGFFPKLWFEIMNEYVRQYKDNGKVDEKVKEIMKNKIRWFLVKFTGVLSLLNILGFIV